MTNFSNQIDQNQNFSNSSNPAQSNAAQPSNNPTTNEAVQNFAEQVENVPNQVEEVFDQVSEQVESVKSTITKPLPTPPEMSTDQASAEELFKRLNWGEPALTIIDVRSREAFNDERITGAVPIPSDQIPQEAEATLEYKRDLYVYGDSDETAVAAAQQLRQAGYRKVAQLQGGLPAWKAVGGPTEGISAFSSPVRSQSAIAGNAKPNKA